MEKFIKNIRKRWSEYLIFSGLSIFTAIFLYPFVLLVINSFKPSKSTEVNSIVYHPTAFPTHWDLSYILKYIESTNYFLTLMISIIVTVVSVLLLNVVAALVAWMLVRNKTKISTIVFLVLVGAMLVPFQSLMFPLVKFMDILGLRNIPGLIFMYLGFGMSFTVFLYHGFLKSVPLDLEEAAFIDGANFFQIFFQVVIPLVAPITVTTAILNAKWIFNDFLLPFLILGSRDGYTTLP